MFYEWALISRIVSNYTNKRTLITLMLSNYTNMYCYEYTNSNLHEFILTRWINSRKLPSNS